MPSYAGCADRVAATQIDPAGGQIDGRNRRRCSVYIHSGRVQSLALIVIHVEFHGNAIQNAAGAARMVWPVPQAAAEWTQSIRSVGLQLERYTVSERQRTRQLKGEVGGETLNVHWSICKGTAGLVNFAGGQLQPAIVGIYGAAIESQSLHGCKSITEVYCGLPHERAGPQ